MIILFLEVFTPFWAMCHSYVWVLLVCCLGSRSLEIGDKYRCWKFFVVNCRDLLDYEYSVVIVIACDTRRVTYS